MGTNNKPWYFPRTPDEIVPIPWLHHSVIDYLDSILQPEWSVLEHGSGGSTLWLAERVHRVVSIEHVEEWREKVRALAPGNVTLLVEPPYCTGIPMFDMLIIDGEREMRGPLITRAPLYVIPGGWVVLDNANRPEYAAERKALFGHAALIERFDNNIPGYKFVVTEFWKCHASE